MSGCSSSSTSCPSTDGVSAGAMIDVLGRLPEKARAGSSDSLPYASALVCARKFASSSSCTSVSPSVSGCAGEANAMKSAGISRVP